MLSNITSINLDLQTQGSALVAKQINALVSPARRIYVFGTATDAFPYFSTFANALTYANSLTPSTTNPVSIVLLSKSDNTPVTITGNDDWYALCLDGIYVSSPYREIFSTTTLPTTLPKGMRVMYEDANGVESLWVGNADGNAWPAVGYKEYFVRFAYNGIAISITAVNDQLGGVAWAKTGTGTFTATKTGAFARTSLGGATNYLEFQIVDEEGVSQKVSFSEIGSDIIRLTNFVDGTVSDDQLSASIPVYLRIYP